MYNSLDFPSFPTTEDKSRGINSQILQGLKKSIQQQTQIVQTAALNGALIDPKERL